MTWDTNDADGQLYRYRFGSCEFDESTLELWVSGEVARPQRLPLEVLAVLLRHDGDVVTREELKKRVWDGRHTVAHVINNAVKKLRAVLGTDGAMVLTLPRVGYRFAGDVQRSAVRRAVGSKLALEEGHPVPGRRDFILERLLGRSAEHEVWCAHHCQTGELRVYKFCIEGIRVAGLKREASFARLLHDTLGPRDDLVHLIDWNFAEAPYYLESEYGGISLREWADDGKVLAALEPGSRLGLFLQIVDAVAAAHSVGVLHKDLKPSNVLVKPRTDGWQLQIADFGSGRLLEPDRLSALGLSRLGFTLTHPSSEGDGSTLLYMAPELLSGAPATVQSDVYALGLMLYQLVTGDLTRPLVPGWDRNIDDPLLRADIAHATDVDPTRRTASAAQLADAIRSLATRRREAESQVQAEAERTLLLEAQRRRAARAPWVRCTIALLVVGLASSAALYWRTARTAGLLREQVDLVQRLNTFLAQEFINAANPERTGRSDMTVASAAHAAAAQIDRDFSQGPLAFRARLHFAIAEAFSGLSDYPSAVAESEYALRDLTAAGPPAPLEIAKIKLQLASDLADSSRYEEAQAALDHAALLLHDNTGTPRARADYVRGRLEANRQDFKASAQAFRTALQVARTAVPGDPELIARIQFSLGDTLTLSGQYAEGERVLRALIDEQVHRGGAHSILAERTRIALASNLGYQRQFTEAEALARQAAAHFNDAFGPDHRRTIQSLFMLGNVYFEEKQYVKAAAVYADAYQRIDHSSGPKGGLAVATATNQAQALHLAGQTEDAAVLLRTQLGIAREFLAESSPRVQVLRYHLADCNLDLHRGSDEVTQLLVGLSPEVLQAAEQETDWDGRLAYEQGRLALAQGKRKEARDLLGAALRIITERDPDGPISPPSIRALLEGLNDARSAT